MVDLELRYYDLVTGPEEIIYHYNSKIILRYRLVSQNFQITKISFSAWSFVMSQLCSP